MGPVGPRWDPCWPHEPWYLGWNVLFMSCNTFLPSGLQWFEEHDADVQWFLSVLIPWLQCCVSPAASNMQMNTFIRGISCKPWEYTITAWFVLHSHKITLDKKPASNNSHELTFALSLPSYMHRCTHSRHLFQRFAALWVQRISVVLIRMFFR